MTDFNRHPDSYHHWQLEYDGAVAHLRMNVNPEHPFRDGYELKLNSYDLAVDIELADAIQRLRFERPDINAVVIGSGQERAFCAGANIVMLKSSTHPFKVNFCKFTNETRLSLEDLSQHSGVRSICAINAACAGGGYELALACDEIHLVNDNNSAVSLPEVPLLGVLPGTGGLTRLVDKRKIRRDHADVFCTLAEGLRGKKALKWNFVDAIWPKSKFHDQVGARAAELAGEAKDKGAAKGIELKPIHFDSSEEDGKSTMKWEHVTVTLEHGNRVARITMTGPIGDQPKDGPGFEAAGCDTWAIKAWREFDDALLQLRFDHEEIGLVVLETRGDRGALVDLEKTLDAHQDHWLCKEILLHTARVCRRWDLMARSTYALVDEKGCAAGAFLELMMACDRIYALDEDGVDFVVGPLSDGDLPMSHGLSRLQNRFLATPEQGDKLAEEQATMIAPEADEEGLVTYLLDPVDWEDDVRIALEERVSLSPDALTGMEASLRFGGAENCDSKIFGRLSAWQNWIFTRPNATGDEGALTRYGAPEGAQFDWRRT